MVAKRPDESKSIAAGLLLGVRDGFSAFRRIAGNTVGCGSNDLIYRTSLGFDNQDTDIRDNDHEIRAAISNVWFVVNAAVFPQVIQQIENLPLALIQAVRKIGWEERCHEYARGIVAGLALC